MILDKGNVYLLLGSNLGDRMTLLREATREVELQIGKVFAISSYYETAAWGNTEQPSFLNLAVGLNTFLPPFSVLEQALAIEEHLGRIRLEKWGSRLIDIDIIFYDDLIIDNDRLRIPHPEMANRRFVLGPLAEIAPKLIHPISKKSVATMLSEISDNLVISKFK
ncbi:2-amino-4-hydroxy-6-hydroxymethyldihydropteridine diphosphokinase [Pedobacter sp. UYP24]